MENRVDKKSIIISIILVVVIGLVIGFWISNRDKGVVEYGDAVAAKPTNVTVEKAREYVFARGMRKVYVYKDGVKFKVYKRINFNWIVRIANDAYYRVYKEKPIKKMDRKYDVRFQFSSKCILYLDTKSKDRSCLFVKDDKMIKGVLTEREYDTLAYYLKIEKSKKKSH